MACSTFWVASSRCGDLGRSKIHVRCLLRSSGDKRSFAPIRLLHPSNHERNDLVLDVAMERRSSAPFRYCRRAPTTHRNRCQRITHLEAGSRESRLHVSFRQAQSLGCFCDAEMVDVPENQYRPVFFWERLQSSRARIAKLAALQRLGRDFLPVCELPWTIVAVITLLSLLNGFI